MDVEQHGLAAHVGNGSNLKRDAFLDQRNDWLVADASGVFVVLILCRDNSYIANGKALVPRNRMDRLTVVARHRGLIAGRAIVLGVAPVLENLRPGFFRNQAKRFVSVPGVLAVGVQDRADLRRVHPVPPGSDGNGSQRTPAFAEQIQ